MDPPILVERREVYYLGHVQGVGFRYTVLRTASRRRVAGYVENLPDGRVHLVAEGPSDELDRLLAEVEMQMRRHIRGTNVEKGVATGEFEGFEIR